MKLQPKVISLALLSTLLISSYSQAQYAAQERLDAKAAEAYWTPERMRAAIPYPMPIAKDEDIHVVPASQLPQARNPAFSDGAPPRFPMKPDSRRLFVPKKMFATSIFKDRGTSNQDYSSSSLVPETADLAYPYSAVGRLYFLEDGIGYVCSASLIAPRVLITAGHCVYGPKGMNKSFQFTPAFRNGAAPYQTWGATFAIGSATWTSGNRSIPNQADYALLEMVDHNINNTKVRIGDVVGFLGYQLQSLVPNHAHLLGFPCNLDSCTKMHQTTAQSAKAVLPNDGEYGSDMLGGASGGPWIQNFGIKSAGQTDGNNPGFNRVLGVSSYARPTERSLGASNLGDEFTVIFNTVCAHQTGNC